MSTQFKAGTWASKIFLLGKETFEKSSNKEIAAMVNCDNQGIVSRERKAVADKTGWTMPVGRFPASTTTEQHAKQPQQQAKRPRKQSGSLPVKVQGFLEGTLADVPDIWEPQHVYPVIDEDSVAWNRFIRRLHDIDSAIIESFELWLGRGATLNRQADFDADLEKSAQWDRKANAETLARELIAMGYGDKTPTAILREGWL